MNTNKLLILALTAAAFFAGCSDEKHTNSWEDENDGASFAEDSFKSSSSLSTRLDIDYNDTLKIGDSTKLHLEIARLDTIKGDGKTTVQLACSEGMLCLDTAATKVSLFLGEFPAGSRISVSAAAGDMKNDTLRIRSEFGDILKTAKPVYDTTKKEDVFSNFMLPGRSTLATNEFITFKEGFYYLDLDAKFDRTSQLELLVTVDTAYYDYIGDTTEVTIGLKDTLRGISIIGSSPKEVSVKFSSNTGYSIDVVAKGKWINSFSLLEKDKQIAADSSIDVLLLPEDSTAWTLKIKPLNIENYLSGPFATFEAVTNSRELGKGEYLAFPDSISKLGDALEVVRERNTQAKYYLRQEQFVWLADMKKGDSIDVYQEMVGYFGGVNNKSYTIVDKDGKELGTISSMERRFKATQDGAVYLHYLSTCPYLSNDNADESLKFVTRVSYYGALSSFFFNDKDNSNKALDTTYIVLGDTVYLGKFTFRSAMSRTMTSGAGSSVKWFVPCEDIVPHDDGNGFTTVPVFNVQNVDCTDKSGNLLTEGEQEISSSRLIPLDESEGGTFRLIAESLADPLKRDTLAIIVQ